MSSQSLTIVEHVKKNPRPSGFATYAKAVRKFNLDTPILVAHNGKVYKRKTTAHVVSLRKHSGRHHHHPHPGKDDIDEVPAKDVQQDLEYVVPVTIGTPGVTLNLDFDTGSSDLWVWSTGVPGSKAGHHIYDPKKSSTAKPVEGATWSIKYGDGSSASGTVFNDVIKIGDLEIKQQAVEAAVTLSEAFLDSTGSDGLLGLAWPNINTVQPKPVSTPVENIIQDHIASGVFSVLFNKDANGFYTFGGIDPAKAGVEESKILYTPVDNSEGFWQFKSESIVINGKVVEQSGNTAILDTGTTLCLLADEIIQEIYKLIPDSKLDEEQGGYVYPNGSQVPEIDIFIGEDKYRLNRKDFDFGPASKGYTFGGLQSRGNNPFDILGDVFLKSIYAVFDQDKARVGVAQRPEN